MVKINTNNYLMHPKADKKTHIIIQITSKGRRIRVLTQNYIHPKNWSFKGKKAKSSYSNSFKINKNLNEIESKIMEMANNQFNINGFISLDDLKKNIDSFIKGDYIDVDKNDFFGMLNEFIEKKEQNPSIANATVKVYKTVYNDLKEYTKDIKGKVTITSLKEQFFTGFQNYLLNKQDRNCNRTINKKFTKIRAFLNYCSEIGIPVDNSYKNMKLRTCDPVKFVFQPIDIQKLWNYKPNSERENDYKELLLIQNYMGTRIGKFRMLCSDDFDMENDCYEFTTIKTKSEAKGKIAQKIRELVQKHFVEKKTEFSSQKYNQHIKKICKRAGIDRKITLKKMYGTELVTRRVPAYEVVSSHSCRGALITNLLKAGRLANEIIKITGHTSVESLNPYIKLIEEDTSENIKQTLEEIY